MKNKNKFELKVWAAFLVSFFAMLGIKVKYAKAKKALRFAEKFFKKMDKRQRTHRREYCWSDQIQHNTAFVD